MVRARVTGRVQGVFYRQTTKEKASALRLSGWVRNMADGSVLIEAAGDPDQVEALVTWLSEGPPAARVERVEIETEETLISEIPPARPCFEIR